MSRDNTAHEDRPFFYSLIFLFQRNISNELELHEKQSGSHRYFNFFAQQENFCGIDLPSLPLTDLDYKKRLADLKSYLLNNIVLSDRDRMELIHLAKITRQFLLISFSRFPMMLSESELNQSEYAYGKVCKRTAEFIAKWEKSQKERAELIKEFFLQVDFSKLKNSLIKVIQSDADDVKSTSGRSSMLNEFIKKLNLSSTDLISNERQIIDVINEYCFYKGGSKSIIHRYFVLKESDQDNHSVSKRCAEFVFEKIFDGVPRDQIIEEKVTFKNDLLRDRLNAEQDKLISTFVELQIVIGRIDNLYEMVGKNNDLNADIKNALLERYAQLKKKFFHCVRNDKQKIEQLALPFLKESLNSFVYSEVIPKALLKSHIPTNLRMLSCFFPSQKRKNVSFDVMRSRGNQPIK